MNKNTILLGFLILLGLGAFLLMQRPGEQSSPESGGSHLFQIDSLSVDRIEIRLASGVIVLEKQGADWMVREPLRSRADQTAVTTLIHDLMNARSQAVVSNNPEKQPVFQVDSTGSIMKVFERGTEKTSVIIGKPGSSFSDVYVRIPPSNDVLLVEGSLSNIPTKTVKDWRDRSILALPKEEIKEVSFRYGDTTFVLALRDSAWMIGKDPTQEWMVNSLLAALAAFQADDFVDNPPSPAPRFSAFITVAGLQLRFAPQKGGDKFYVQSSASPQWYEVQQWRASQVLKRKKDFVKPRT